VSEFSARARPPHRTEQAPVASIRVVEITSEGMWRVRSPGAQRASALLDTRGQAEARAREILRKCGGGEIRVYDTSGDPFSYTVPAESALPGRRQITREPRR
jgi:uncharacterized protein DUF2188